MHSITDGGGVTVWIGSLNRERLAMRKFTGPKITLHLQCSYPFLSLPRTALLTNTPQRPSRQTTLGRLQTDPDACEQFVAGTSATVNGTAAELAPSPTNVGTPSVKTSTGASAHPPAPDVAILKGATVRIHGMTSAKVRISPLRLIPLRTGTCHRLFF